MSSMELFFFFWQPQEMLKRMVVYQTAFRQVKRYPSCVCSSPYHPRPSCSDFSLWECQPALRRPQGPSTRASGQSCVPVACSQEWGRVFYQEGTLALLDPMPQLRKQQDPWGSALLLLFVQRGAGQREAAKGRRSQDGPSLLP